jgi:hypothetical protein
MASNRHVPFITGVVAIGVAIWLGVAFSGWWKFLVGGFLLWFGWVALKIGISATDRETEELTESGPVSKKTEDRLKSRM